jgi:ribosome-associated protein
LNNPDNLAQEMADILDDKKAEDVVMLDISKLSVLADYFVIASGRSEVQVNALYDELQKKMASKGIFPRHLDKSDRWIVLDYGDIIVHIFHREERTFYNIERLWTDAEQRPASYE